MTSCRIAVAALLNQHQRRHAFQNQKHPTYNRVSLERMTTRARPLSIGHPDISRRGCRARSSPRTRYLRCYRTRILLPRHQMRKRAFAYHAPDRRKGADLTLHRRARHVQNVSNAHSDDKRLDSARKHGTGLLVAERLAVQTPRHQTVAAAVDAFGEDGRDVDAQRHRMAARRQREVDCVQATPLRITRLGVSRFHRVVLHRIFRFEGAPDSTRAAVRAARQSRRADARTLPQSTRPETEAVPRAARPHRAIPAHRARGRTYAA